MTEIEKSWITYAGAWDKISSPDDLPVTVTRNSLRQFVLEILKEKGLLQENNQ